MSSTDDFKSQVLQATDIVALIGQSVSLKRRGKDFVGLCPFHQEKTPSFYVSPSKQFFHCYGCKEGGNAIDFVIKRDHLEFLDAMKMLAERAGLEMPRYGVSKQKTGERQQLLDAHSAACSVFQKLLAGQTGTAAREYLEKRGFTEDSIQKFQIGFAPESWDTLLRSDAMRKFPPPLLATAGLIKARQTGAGFYDTFRNRVIFPIRDDSGRIIAFGGRIMPGAEDPAKYLNSPETPLFSKSRCIFGVDLARQQIVETRVACVVEGYTDVVMAHQFGCTNVVSILGTAMTEQHVNILKRFADRIVLLFDSDTAGDAAVDKAVSLFLTQPIEIQIASIPHGVDPDELLLQQGPDAFNQLLTRGTDALAYKWAQLHARFQKSENDLTGQQKAVDEYLSAIADARGGGPIDSLRWGAILARVAKLTEIPIEQLHRRFRPRRPAPTQSPGKSTPVSPIFPVGAGPLTALDRAERQILGLLLLHPAFWVEVQQKFPVETFTDEHRRRLAELYWDHHRNEGEPVFSEFLTTLNQANLAELGLELVEEWESIQDADVENAIRQAIEYVSRAANERRGRLAVAKLRDKLVDNEVDILRELTDLANKRKKNV